MNSRGEWKSNFAIAFQEKNNVGRNDQKMKQNRHTQIVQIIENHDVETQEELAEYLKKAGYAVTQATVSRDIRELKLTKIPIGQGKQKYIILKDEDGNLGDKYIRVLREGYVSMVQAENIVVMKTVSGMAMAVALAIDAMKMPEVAGCVAGDDTIFIAVKSTLETKSVMERIESEI